MSSYRKKPIVIEATQWFKNGDHPKDDCSEVQTKGPTYQPILTEGLIVRYYRHPSVDGQSLCKHCNKIMHTHGWIDTLEGGHIVCPGDYIITGVAGEVYPCKPDIFEKTYDEVGTEND